MASRELSPKPGTGKRAGSIAAKYGIRTPYILSVGRLNARKNLAVLAEAYSLAKKGQSLPHTLVVVGKKDHGSGGLVESVRKTGGGEILFTGFVPDEDLPGLYAGAGCPCLSLALRGVRASPDRSHGFGSPRCGLRHARPPGDHGRRWLGRRSPSAPEMAAAISGLVKDEGSGRTPSPEAPPGPRSSPGPGPPG